MILSIIVFLTILLISWRLTTVPFIEKYRNIDANCRITINYIISTIIPIIIVSLLIGLRENVGTDWQDYYENSKFINTKSLSHALNQHGNFEWLYTTFTYVLRKLCLPPYSIFIFFTLFCLILFYISFKNKKSFLPEGIYSLYTSPSFFLFLNIMRQAISFFIILFSIKYIQYKKPIKFFIALFLATGFHKTSWILAPFYLLAYYRKILLPTSVCLILFFITWVKGDLLYDTLLLLSSNFLDTIYPNYLYKIGSWEMEQSTGIGHLMINICDIILFLFSSKCYEKYYAYGYDIYFNIFLIGALLQNIAGFNLLLYRIPFCLYSMRIIVAAFTLHYLIHRSFPIKKNNVKYSLITSIYIGCSILYFIGNIISFDYSFII